VDKKSKTMEKSEYKFASTGIDAFLSEIKEPKQEFAQSQSIFDALPEESAIENNAEPAAPRERTTMTKSASNAAGELATTVTDTVLPMLIGMIAQSDSARFKATETEREELKQALSRYLELKGDIPPGVMLIIIIAVIYGSKIPAAIELRKQKKLADTQAKELSELREKLKKYERADN
jgi:hypothetical protein